MPRDKLLKSRQMAFRAAALGGDPAPVVAELAANGIAPAKRFAVYRASVLNGLIEALEAAFPATHARLSDDFRPLAAAFCAAHPPAKPQLCVYGEGFAAFAAARPEAKTRPWLCDLIALEWARVESYFAADAAPLPPAALAAVPPDQLESLRLRAHPALRLVASAHPILDLVEGRDGVGEGQNCLISRPLEKVRIEALSPGLFALIAALADGQALGQAAEKSLAAEPGFDLAQGVASLLDLGAFCGIHTGR